MFSISRRAGYGLEFLTVLAKQNRDKVVSLRQLTKSAKLPYRFVSQAAVALKNAGVIGAKEGFGGGYFLRKKPENVTVAEVVTILEGRKGIVACMVDGSCSRDCSCLTKPVWQQIQKDILQIMKEYTLADLIRESGGEKDIKVRSFLSNA